MRRRTRRGLSTLEMVMSLPILLMVMALMINFGTVASWKVRGLSLARHQLWSHREGYSGGAYPPTQYWPQYSPTWPAGVSQGSGNSWVGELDNVPGDPQLHHAVARGPTVGDPPAPGRTFLVDPDLLNPARGRIAGYDPEGSPPQYSGALQEGNSSVSRRFPLLQRLSGYHLRSRTQSLDTTWPFHDMGARENHDFRLPLIYTVPQGPGDSEYAQFAQDYIDAVARIWYAPFQADLWPLDKDDEFWYWGKRFRAQGLVGNPPWPPPAPDFYVWANGCCDADDACMESRIDDVVDRIEGNNGHPGVVKVMTQRFIDFFNQVIEQLQAELAATPPPPNTGQIQQEIDALKQEIGQLGG